MKSKKEPITQKLYGLIPSQQTMYLMVKYSLHKQLVQIPISFSVEKDLDFGVLKQAWNIEIERNDSLRLRYVMVNKEVKQYFLDRYTMNYIQRQPAAKNSKPEVVLQPRKKPEAIRIADST